MAQSITIRKLGATLALLGLFLLAQTAECEQLYQHADSVYSEDADMLMQEEQSDASKVSKFFGDDEEGINDDGEPDMQKLEGLEKAWKAKEAGSSKSFRVSTSARKAQLREHMHQERAAKLSVQLQTQVSADEGDDKGDNDEIPARGAVDEDKARKLAEAQETITHLQQKLKDTELKADLTKKKVKVESKQDADKISAETKLKYRKKLDAASKQLIEDHKREAAMVKQVVKDRTKAEATAVKLQDMAKRKDMHKDDYEQTVQENKALQSKLEQEKALRGKAVNTVMQLAKKVKTLGQFGKQSADLAKSQALKAEKATADAQEQVSLVKADKLKAKEETARVKAEKRMEEQKLQELKAQLTALQAETIHEKTRRHQTELSLAGTQARLNQTLLEEDALKGEVLKHKLAEKVVAKEAAKRKEEEKKALLALEKVDVIKKALTVAQTQVQRYRKENKLQRVELGVAAETQMEAANVTQSVARDAENIEQAALTERASFDHIVKAAKTQLSKEHGLRMGDKKKTDTLLEKAKVQLVQEHKLRVSAQDEVKTSQGAAAAAAAQAKKDHQDMLAIKATADKITADRERLIQRTKAATQMIAVQQEATSEAKKAAVMLQQADAKKMADLTSQYDQKLAAEHAKSVQAQSIATTITTRTGALQEAIAHQKEILKEEQTKALNERQQWHKAMDAFKTERSAHQQAKGAMDASSRAMAQKAQLAIQRATQLAKDKDMLINQLKTQVEKQAGQFSTASSDWAKVKKNLMMRVQAAEEEASDANAKIAELTKEHGDMSATRDVQEAMDATRAHVTGQYPGSDMELAQVNVEPISEDEFDEDSDY